MKKHVIWMNKSATRVSANSIAFIKHSHFIEQDFGNPIFIPFLSRIRGSYSNKVKNVRRVYIYGSLGDEIRRWLEWEQAGVF